MSSGTRPKGGKGLILGLWHGQLLPLAWYMRGRGIVVLVSSSRDGEVINFQGSSVSDAHDVVRLAEQGLIRSDADLFTLDNVTQAYEALHHGHLRGRAVVTPNG